MKKGLKFYVAFWAVLLAVFNVISFVSTGWVGCEKYTPAFWCGYTFVMLSFAVNMLYALLAFRAKNTKQVFYNLAYFRVGYIGLLASFAVGGLFMLTPAVWLWVCVLVCVITMGIHTVAFIKAKAAVQMAEGVEEKVAQNTVFIKLLAADARSLVDAAGNEENRALAQKVHDAVRYADPVSNAVLAEAEQQLRASFEAFSKAVLNGEEATAAAEKVLYQLNVRNQRCKALK